MCKTPNCFCTVVTGGKTYLTALMWKQKKMNLFHTMADIVCSPKSFFWKWQLPFQVSNFCWTSTCNCLPHSTSRARLKHSILALMPCIHFSFPNSCV